MTFSDRVSGALSGSEFLENHPFLVLVAGLGLGILGPRLLPASGWICVFVSGCCFLGAGFLSLYRNRLGVALGSGLTALVVSAFALASAADVDRPDGLETLAAKGVIPLGEPVYFYGCVDEETLLRGTDLLATVSVWGVRTGSEWRACRGRVRVSLNQGTRGITEGRTRSGLELSYGDRIQAWVYLNRPRNYENPGSQNSIAHYGARGIDLVGRIRSARLVEILPGGCGSFWKQRSVQVRSYVRETLGSTDDPRGASEILAAMLIGDSSRMSAATRELFQNSGTYHLLVVSGLHVGWVAWILSVSLRSARVPQAWSRLLVAIGVVTYGCLVGFGAGVSRAVWMCLLYLAGESGFRKAPPLNLLLAAAFVILAIDPKAAIETGYQLSFLSVSAVFLCGLPLFESCVRPVLEPISNLGLANRCFLNRAAGYRRGRRLRNLLELALEAWLQHGTPRLQQTSYTFVRALSSLLSWVAVVLVISLCIQIWIGPVLAWNFNRISWIAPLSNLAMIPLASLTLSAAMMALPLDALAGQSWGLECALLLSEALESTSQWFAEIPGAWLRCPTPVGAAVVAGLIGLFLSAVLRPRLCWLASVSVMLHLAILCWGLGPLESLLEKWRSLGLAPTERKLELTFLDVGQGDAAVIRFPNGKVWVLDAGGRFFENRQEPNPSSLDVGETVVSRFLWQHWIRRIDRIILSHPHQDHGGGIPAVLENFRVNRFDYGYLESPFFLEIAHSGTVEPVAIRAGQSADMAGVRVSVLNPWPNSETQSVNDNSVVLKLEFDRFTALLTGDLEASGESRLLERWPGLRCQLLKVAHHGSRSGTGDRFLAAAKPSWAVISSGRRNPFGHPSRSVLMRLLAHGALPLLTVDHGAVFFETDGQRYTLRTHVNGILAQGELPE